MEEKEYPTPDNPVPIEQQMEYYYDTGEEMLIKGYKDITKNYVSKEYHEMVVKEQNDIIDDLKEKNKKLEEEKAAYVKGYTIASDEYVETTIKKIKQKDFYEKVINMMTEDIFNGFVLGFNNEGQVKEYYFKKARGE